MIIEAGQEQECTGEEEILGLLVRDEKGLYIISNDLEILLGIPSPPEREASSSLENGITRNT